MRLLRSSLGLALAVVLAIGAVAIGAHAAPALAQDRDGGGEQGMHDAINARRLAQGLTPLERDARLDAAAARHSAEMADHDVLEHVSQDSGTPADRVQAAGLEIAEIAENVAMHNDTGSAQQALEQSDAHLANMLNPRFTHVGIAAVRDERGFYVTQVFGRIEPSAPPIAEAPAVVEIAPAEESALVPPMTQTAPEVRTQISVPQVAAQGGYVAQAAPGAPPTVIGPGPGSRPLAGYWVCAQSRWWYFPMPAGAQPGQQLHADTSITGAPPGYSATGCIAGQMVQPTQPPPQVYQPPPQVHQPPPQVYYPQPPPPQVYYPPPPPPRVYYPPPPRVYYPPPRRGSRYIVVQPPPGRMIVPYAPRYRGGGVSIEVGPGPRGRVRGWRR